MWQHKDSDATTIFDDIRTYHCVHIVIYCCFLHLVHEMNQMCTNRGSFDPPTTHIKSDEAAEVLDCLDFAEVSFFIPNHCLYI